MPRRSSRFIVSGVGLVVFAAAFMVLPRSLSAQRQAKPPVTMHPHDLDASYIRMPLPPGEQQYGRIDGEHLRGIVTEITAVSRKSRDDGELIWGRVAGTKYDDMVEGLVESKFKQVGLQDVHRQYFDLPPQWFPTKFEFAATAAAFPAVKA